MTHWEALEQDHPLEESLNEQKQPGPSIPTMLSCWLGAQKLTASSRLTALLKAERQLLP